MSFDITGLPQTNFDIILGGSPSIFKTWNGIPIANIKTINGIPIANIKTWNNIS